MNSLQGVIKYQEKLRNQLIQEKETLLEENRHLV